MNPNALAPVLILAGTRRVVVTIARALHRHSIPVDVAIMASESDGTLRSRAIRNVFLLPDWHVNPQAFVETLSHLIVRHRYDVVFPTTDDALTAVSRWHSDLSTITTLACPPRHVILRVLDKRITLQAASRCGIVVPGELMPLSPEDLLQIPLRAFPLVAKLQAKDAKNNSRVRYFADHAEVQTALAQHELGPSVLLQEYCPGEGVGIEVLMREGEALALFQHRRIREFPASGGVSVLSEAEPVDPHAAEQAIRLLRELEWEGVAMVEFRRDPATNRLVLMEVNGRYWGSLALASRAGVDFPYYQWLVLHGQSPRPPVVYLPGLQVRWLAGDLQRFINIVRNSLRGTEPASAIVSSLSALVRASWSARDALWSSNDPLPAWDDFHALLATIGRRIGLPLWRTIPQPLRDGVRIAKRHGVLAGVLYLRAKRCEKERQGVPVQSSIDPQAQSFLFVCSGNIIRSPMAAALCRTLLSLRGIVDIEVQSAGLDAIEDFPVDPRALEIAQCWSISLAGHRARPVSTELLSAADVVFVMDHRNEAVFLSRYPHHAHKLVLLGRCSEDNEPAPTEIPDPFNGSAEDIRKSYERISDCTNVLTLHLAAKRPVGVGA